MKPEHWTELKELFEEALAVPPGERRDYLDRLAGCSDEVRAELANLLRLHEESDGFLELSRGGGPALEGPGVLPEVPGYTVLHQIHGGAQGVVYKALQESTNRVVALKVLRDGPWDSPERRRRFEREIELVASLKHPGIVTVYESGTTEDGRLFFAMEYVEGLPVGPAAVRGDLRQVLRLVARICAAVHFAHQRGILHRDLKPENLLVDAQGEPHVVDFGVARVTETGEQPGTLLTSPGMFVGTLAYAAPEQVSGDSASVDLRADVYSLGVVLYQLLAGRFPYPVGERMADTARAIVEAPPAPLGPSVPRDVQTIVAKALAKDPDRRYQQAGDLGADLLRFLDGEPIEARRDSTLYVVSRVLRRHRWASGAAAVALGAILVLAVVATVQWRQAQGNARSLLRLSDRKSLDDLIEAAGELWPAYPDRIPAYEDWLRQAQALETRLEDHRAMLSALRARSLPDSGEDGTAPRFAREEDAWWYATLAELIADLEQFSATTMQDVTRRREFARTVRERTVDGEEAASLWDEAILSIADPEECPLYDGLFLEPQLGLLPVGRDPDSGLWEFVHVQSGSVPVREDGRLVMEEDTGLVFVLLPGGTFWMGAQQRDRDAPNFDPQAKDSESPVHEITLAPFFLSRYEMTQGQWLRCTGKNPSVYAPPVVLVGKQTTLEHPVEGVSWIDCIEVLGRLGLTLPTEAQWEYGARGGTSTPWCFGERQEDLVGQVNFADLAAVRAGGGGPPAMEPFWRTVDDGYSAHAPADSFAPNPFGLHHVHGNVLEWCRDRLGRYSGPVDPVDGLRLEAEADACILRGGSFYLGADRARSASRSIQPAASADQSGGLRPARALEE